MDLQSWITSDLQMARQRLAGQVLDLIPVDRMTEQVDGGGIPPVYVLWHMSRHHDLAVNQVLRGVAEVVHAHTDELGVHEALWRGLSEGADLDLVDELHAAAVGRYALAVLDESIMWLSEAAVLPELDGVPDSGAALSALGTPTDDFGWLYSMWEGKPASWFLSWEGVGHITTHTGELVSIRNRMGLSPF